MKEFPNWIDNEPREGSDGRVVSNPWDGSGAARVSVGTRRDVEAAIESAAKAFAVVSRTSSGERSAWLAGIAAGLERNREAIADEIRHEAGKPITLARTEVDRAIQTFRLGAEEAKRIGGDVLPLDATVPGRGRFGLTRRFPRGVVAGIVPFNFPLNLAAHKVAPALACGGTIVLKPPPQAPGPTLWLGELARDAGVPPGAVNVVYASVEDASPLVDDPRVAVLSFTGSARVGWELKKRAARKMVILELGGNAALVVDRTADLDLAAAKAAVASYAFAGQVCIKAQRIFVEETVYADFRARLLAAIREQVKVGDPADPGTVCGPVIDDAAADRIETWTREAVAAGATTTLGGERKGRLLPPVLLENVPADARVSCEEIFGPVTTLRSFASADEAAALVNDGPYGLQAGLFTRDLSRTLAAFETFQVGAVVVNDAPTFRVDAMPYGGVKESGFGREGLRYAIEEMTESRLLILPPPS